MSIIRLTCAHSLEPDVVQERVQRLGKTLELLSQAQIGWRDSGRAVLEFDGPNVEGQFRILDGTLEVSIRLGPALRIVAETMRQVFAIELKRALANEDGCP